MTQQKTQQKVTYTTIGSSEDFHVQFDKAVEQWKSNFGKLYPNVIGGVPVKSDRTNEDRSPIDTSIVVGITQKATKEEATKAIEMAHKAFPKWRDMGWKERVTILRRSAEIMSERKFYLAALMCWEDGKNRLEAMGEVEEAADLIRYYCALMEEHDGYVKPMMRVNPTEKTSSHLLPYGLWSVVAPFNFPLALATGMTAGALVTGNTVVFKPATDTPLIGYEMVKAFHDGGVPGDVIHFLAGKGSEFGPILYEHPSVQGVAFTGSYEVGMNILRGFGVGKYPKPVVCEMGGKNPTVICKSADMDVAVEGVYRSAFGFGGQKCSACSRVYIMEPIREEFMAKLIEKTKSMKIGNPSDRDVFLGPLVNKGAVESFEGYVKRMKDSGIKVVAGGSAMKEGMFAKGYFVEPTIGYTEDKDNELFYEEMFVPILLATSIKTLDEGIDYSNRAIYGLCAGIMSKDPAEVDKFMNNIQAGVCYANRRGGATTGAWPGVNPFGGWKASGSTGVSALGPYYPIRFMREQSRTINE